MFKTKNYIGILISNYLNIEAFLQTLQYLNIFIYANLPDVEAITNGA
jgi:hypothetical protein